MKFIVAWFRIPRGPYCYSNTWKPFPGKILKWQPDKHKICHYWKRSKKAHWANCNYLKVTKDILLLDQCKICGIKDD